MLDISRQKANSLKAQLMQAPSAGKVDDIVFWCLSQEELRHQSWASYANQIEDECPNVAGVLRYAETRFCTLSH